MDPLLIDRSRRLLAGRVQWAKTCPLNLFRSACVRLMAWIEAHPVLNGIVQNLTPTAIEIRDEHLLPIIEAAKTRRGYPDPAAPIVVANNDVYHAALCYVVVEAVARSEFDDSTVEKLFLDWLGWLLTGEVELVDPEKPIACIRDVAISGLHQFLDERLDARNAMMAVLLKYKHRSEWFRRRRLREVAANGLEARAPGERSLAVDLQEYIFDQGVEFSIEPTSASGEADLILREVDGRHVVIDAKFIPDGASPSAVKKKLASGFHQVARYCDDFQEPAGFLVVYLGDLRTPRLSLTEQDGFRFLLVKGKLIYYLPISIADSGSASRSGQASEIDVPSEDLLKIIEDESSPS